MSILTFEVEVAEMPSDKTAADGVANALAEALKNISFPHSENGENTKVVDVKLMKSVKTHKDFSINPDLKEIGSFIVEEVDYAVQQWGYDIGNKFGIDECCDWKRITTTLEKMPLDDIIIVFTYVKECTDDWRMIIEPLAEHLVEHFDTDEAEKELYGTVEELSREK